MGSIFIMEREKCRLRQKSMVLEGKWHVVVVYRSEFETYLGSRMFKRQGYGRYTRVPHPYWFFIEKRGSSGEEGTFPDYKWWRTFSYQIPARWYEDDFWKKPVGDKGTFKLMLFACLLLMRTWILLSRLRMMQNCKKKKKGQDKWTSLEITRNKKRSVDFISISITANSCCSKANRRT